MVKFCTIINLNTNSIMGKINSFIIQLLLLFFVQGPFQATANPSDNPPCPLPPPTSLNISGISANGISLNWPAAPGAVLYKVTLYDLTNQYAFPDSYLTGTSIELVGLNTLTDSYAIGVSASACPTGNDFGTELQIIYEPGIIIVLDEIVQNCPASNSTYFPAYSQQVIELPFNSSNPNTLVAKHIQIANVDRPDEEFVDFFIWTDCYQNVRFKEMSKKGAKLTGVGNIITYNFEYSDHVFFEIVNGTCDYGVCNVTINYNIDSDVDACNCSLDIEPSTCGEKPDSGAGSGTLDNRVVQENDSDVPAEHLQGTGYNKAKIPESLTTSIEVAPNPFSDHLNIRYQMDQAGPAGIRLFDATGTLVKDLVALEWHDSGAYTTEVSLPDVLPAGMYFLVLQTDGRRIATPLLKQ